MGSYGDRFMHLTNYSVNKKSASYEANVREDDDGVGSKWSVAALKRWFREHGVDDRQTWADIRDIIVKTMVAAGAGVCGLVAACHGGVS